MYQHRRKSSSGRQSAVHLHLKDTDHSFEDSEVQILSRKKKWFERGVKEPIFARKGNPSMNRNGDLRHHLSPIYNSIIRPKLSQWSHSLEKLLASKYGLKIFQAFLKSEYSDENIEFWLVCEDYKKIKSSYRMSSRARRIFKRYIQVEAPKEINIDQKTREIIHQNIAEPIATCFDEAQKIVFGLMEKDSYPRFLRSSLYRALFDPLAAKSVKLALL
uniref:RGS domain-containing protein n=1 Tax=Periophthalmus magnuspinnatus TaxID=409849 RepID=A0A3B4A2E0_9GOBI